MTTKMRCLGKTAIFVLIATCFLQLFASCGSRMEQEKPVELSFFAMDTYMTLKVYRGDKSAEEAKAALAAARDAILEIEGLLSVTSEGSEIAALNRGERVENASAHTVKLLNMAKELHERTDGLYDVTVYPLVLAWGFTTEEGPSVPSASEIEAAMSEIDMARVSITAESDGSYTVDAGGAKLDLGSIAKGYAGQVAAEVLRERGFDNALLVLGGNVQAMGRKPGGGGFVIGIADPDAPERSITTVSTTELDGIFGEGTGYAIVTSGTYQRNFTEDGKTYHHILDVRTGYPAETGLRSVSVICADGALADGLSTSLFLLGYEGAMEYYRTHGGFEAIFVTDRGGVLRTDGIGGQ